MVKACQKGRNKSASLGNPKGYWKIWLSMPLLFPQSYKLLKVIKANSIITLCTPPSIEQVIEVIEKIKKKDEDEE